MLLLLFHLDRDLYGLDAAQIVEVVPLIQLKQIPQAPLGVAGVFNYRGTLTPVIDLCELTLGRPCQRRLSTRVILAQYPVGETEKRLLGLMAERVTETTRKQASDFAPAGVTVDATPYLGRVAADARGIIQLVEIKNLLPVALRDALFREIAEADLCLSSK